MAIVNNTRIVAPVNLSEVRQVMVEASHDLATICKSNKINKWSKYKPINANTLKQLTAQEFANKQYGLSIPSGLKHFGQDTTWGYSKPFGDVTSPYRLTDFLGYEHDAPEVVELHTSLQTGVPEAAQGRDGTYIVITEPFTAWANFNQDSLAGGILPQELLVPFSQSVHLSDYYLGVAVIDDDITSRIVFMGTSYYTIGNNTSLTIPTNALLSIGSGWYQVVFFLCDIQITPQAFPTTKPTWYVPLENGIFRVYYQNGQQYYGWVFWSSHKASNGAVNYNTYQNTISLNQTSGVNSLVVDGTNTPDIRRRISIHNTNVNQHFSNYTFKTTFDPNEENNPPSSFVVSVAGTDGNNVYTDGIIFGFLYEYKGMIQREVSRRPYERVYTWERNLVVIGDGAIVYQAYLDDVTCTFSYSQGSWVDGVVAYEANKRTIGVYISNIVEYQSAIDYLGLQIVLERENNTKVAFEVRNASLFINGEEGYSVYIGDCQSLRTDSTTYEGYPYYNGGEANQCEVDFELLNPMIV